MEKVKSNCCCRVKYGGSVSCYAHTTCELLWLKHLVQELKFCELGPMELRCDNQSAMYLSSNSFFMIGLNT
jgi:hypothetical protein